MQDDAPNQPYIKDLEKALSDFKKFTENYIEEHTKKANDTTEDGDNVRQEASENDVKKANGEKKKKSKAQTKKRKESSDADEDEQEQDGGVFDKMESEDVNNLTVENGEGELINLDDDKDLNQLKEEEKNRARKRKPNTNPVAEEE